MSRCFPYPPPGYVRNGIRDEALIESIKLQREGEKAKKERKKDKKGEKKEQDKKGKEKSHRGNGEVESKHCRHKKRHRDEKKNRENEKGRDLQHKSQNEKEQLENSGLTEEHGHPVGSQNSSDSTLNSQKRQKLSSSPDGGHNSGSIIRIRLPLQRQKGPDVLPNKERPCIAPGTDDPSIHVMHEPTCRPGRDGEEHPCSTSTKVCPDVTLRHNDEKRSTGALESCARKEDTSQALSLCGVCPPDLALKFRSVIGNWVPPTVQNEITDFGDEDWLFESKQNQKCGFRKCEKGTVCSSHANTTTWPQACFLPEVDIHALPFTVPY